MSLQRPISLAVLLLGAAAVLLSGDVRLQTILLLAAVVLLWATLIVPEYFTSLAFIAACLLIGLAPANVAFSGFQAKATWLVFAGIVFSTAITQLNFGTSLFSRIDRLRIPYWKLVWAISVFGFFLAFFLPSSMGRVLLVMPLIKAFCDRANLAEDSNVRTGLYLCFLFGTTFPAFGILTSNVPNMVLLGSVETVLGLTFSYPKYMMLNLPVLGIGSLIVANLLIIWRFPGEVDVREAPPEDEVTGISAAQKRLMAILVVTLGLWVTEELHHIPAAWVGLGAALVCLVPGVGVIPPQTITKLNLGPWIFLAGVIGVGAVASHNGVAEVLWGYFNPVLSLDGLSNFGRYFALVIFTTFLGLVTTLPASPSIFVTLVESIAGVTGWSHEAIAYTHVPAFVFFPFPYQAPPILVGTTMFGVPALRAMRIMVPLWLIGMLGLAPLHYFWARFLGIFP